jgi:pimeloyl-ACP methyl ester carboxylesterase
MYEAPYNDDPAAHEAWRQYIGQLTEVLATGRRGDAIALFRAYTGVPVEQIEAMRKAPSWPAMEAIAPTLRYDHAAILGADGSVPADRAARVAVPVLVMYGDASFPFMGETARTLSQVIPGSQLRILTGESHNVSPAVLAPVLADFFAS